MDCEKIHLTKEPRSALLEALHFVGKLAMTLRKSGKNVKMCNKFNNGALVSYSSNPLDKMTID
jgi:hypothetical protein